MVKVEPSRKVVEQLAAFFHRNGYVRRLNPKRRAADPRGYKKGDEVRLVAESRAELATIRRLLRAAGFKPGRPFRAGNLYRQPVYGRQKVAQFLSLIESSDPS